MSKQQGKKAGGKSNQVPTGAPASQQVPTLDTRNYMYLRGKKDAVEGLDSIQVTFYSSGLIDITYGMVDQEGNPIKLSAAEFHSEVAKASKLKDEKFANGDDVARGAVKKYYNRGLVVLPPGLTNGELKGQVQAIPHPSALKTVLGKSQKDFSDQKLNELPRLLAYWNKMSQEVKDSMDAFQRRVYPEVSESWVSRLARLTDEDIAKAARKAARGLAANAQDGGPHLGVNSTRDQILAMDDPFADLDKPMKQEDQEGDTKAEETAKAETSE